MSTVKKENLPDTDVEWYDFGGGFTVAPTVDAEGKPLPGLQSTAPNMASLCCVKNGKFYYYTLVGIFTKEDLPSMFKAHAPAFEAEVAKAQQ